VMPLSRTAALGRRTTPGPKSTRRYPQTLEWVAKLPEHHQLFIAKYHTTTEQLAALATKAKPGLLIVYHSSISSRPEIAPSGNQPFVISAGARCPLPEVLQKEIGSRYSGHFVIGRDLDVY